MIASAIFSWKSWAKKPLPYPAQKPNIHMALSDCSRQAVWIKALLNELGIRVAPIHINGNNQGSIFIGSNPVQEKTMLKRWKNIFVLCQGCQTSGRHVYKEPWETKIPQNQRSTRI